MLVSVKFDCCYKCVTAVTHLVRNWLMLLDVLCSGYVKFLHQPENELIVLYVLEIDVGKISKYSVGQKTGPQTHDHNSVNSVKSVNTWAKLQARAWLSQCTLRAWLTHC